MSFEGALTYELNTISLIANKIFPLQATEGTSAPYVTYLKGDIRPLRTLTNTLPTFSGTYEINILSSKYSVLQTVYKAIFSKLVGMQGRKIGDNGPYMEEVAILNTPEMYEHEISLYRMIIEFKVTYKEEF